MHQELGRGDVRGGEGQGENLGAVAAVGQPHVEHVVFLLLQPAADGEGLLQVFGQVHHAIAHVGADGGGPQVIHGRRRSPGGQHGIVHLAALIRQHGDLSRDKRVIGALLADERHIGVALAEGGDGVVRGREGDNLHRPARRLRRQ